MSYRASWIQLKGPIQSAKGILPLEIAEGRHQAEHGVRVRKRWVCLDRSLCQCADLRPLLYRQRGRGAPSRRSNLASSNRAGA